MPRLFRFAIQLHGATARDDWIERSRRAEELGYDAVCVPDHVGSQLAPFAALLAVAHATQRIRIGTFVLDNDFRHPVLMAHEAATVQLLSEGRLELGLGAGWLRRDYDGLGIEFAPPRTRVERLEEAVEIVSLYFAGEVFSFNGRHYSVEEVEPLKLPPHLSPPRLVIGGGGRRILTLAGRRADVASVFLKVKAEGSTFETSSPEAHRARIEHVRASAGERADDVEINVLLQAFEVTDDRNTAVERWATEFEMTPDDFVTLPFGLAGTLDEIVDDLQRRRDVYGISYVTVFAEHLETFAPVVERLAGR